MTCLDCQTRLQERLDERRAVLVTDEVADHLADCHICRDFYSLSESSWTGQTVSPFHAAPEGFAERVLQRAGRDRRRRQSRWFAWTLALSFFLVAIVGSASFLYGRTERRPGDDALVKHGTPRPEQRLAALVESTRRFGAVPEAGWEATSRWANQASEHASKWVPERWPQPVVENPLEVTLGPVRAVGQTLACSWEPVAQRAEKAYDRLQRLLPDRQSPLGR